MTKFLILPLLCLLLAGCSNLDWSRKIASSEDSKEMTSRYIKRLHSRKLSSSLSCSGVDSSIRVVFHKKDSDTSTRVSLYGDLKGYDVFIPYFNGHTSKAKIDDTVNVSFGEVMKEFEDGNAFNQEFILNSDELKLAVKITQKKFLKSKKTIEQDILLCELIKE